MDIVNKIFDRTPSAFKTIFDHNRWKTISLLGCLTISGCWLFQSTTQSPSHPDKQLNREQLRAEFEGIVTQYQIAFKDLDAKDQLRQQVGELLQSSVGPLLGQYTGLGLGAIGLLFGTGAVLDKRRADKVIQQKNAEIAELAPDAPPEVGK